MHRSSHRRDILLFKWKAGGTQKRTQGQNVAPGFTWFYTLPPHSLCPLVALIILPHARSSFDQLSGRVTIVSIFRCDMFTTVYSPEENTEDEILEVGNKGRDKGGE